MVSVQFCRNNEITADFFTKFPNIKRVYADKIENAKLFFDFVDKTNLEFLSLICSFKEQEHYDRLASYETIRVLSIETDQAINLDFLFKFKSILDFDACLKLDHNLLDNVVLGDCLKIKYQDFIKKIGFYIPYYVGFVVEINDKLRTTNFKCSEKFDTVIDLLIETLKKSKIFTFELN